MFGISYNPRWFEIHQDNRVFGALYDIVLVYASTTYALFSLEQNPIRVGPGDFGSIACNLFVTTWVQLALHGFVEAAYDAPPPTSIGVSISPRTDISDDRPMRETNRFKSIGIGVPAMAFALFMEEQQDWLKANISTDPNQWPDTLNFGRVVRNAIAHNGCLDIRNPLAPPAKWHHVAYTPQMNGRRVIGDHLTSGDLILLLLEVNEELTRLGAP